jgi:hypothetical protein
MFLMHFMTWFAHAEPVFGSKYRTAKTYRTEIPFFDKRRLNEFTAFTKVRPRLFGRAITLRTIFIA